MKIIILLFLLLNSINGFSQAVIKGIVKSENSLLSNTNVTLSTKVSNHIAAFSFTDKKGYYEIKSTINADTVKLTFSIVGYKSLDTIIANKTETVNVNLTEFATVLPSVTVEQKPITQQGDTTSYNVNQFKGKADRVIGDIIAKLPGVEIDEATGQILFNGKPIKHYYVDGLDLLGGKYNIANRNIPSDMVDQVQMLAHDKDIKLFDSLKISNDPAINIKLKKNAQNKLIGIAKMGIGFAPLLYEEELAGLMFGKKMQFISAYKINNTGIILSNEIADNITIQKMGEQSKKNTKEEMLSTIAAANPSLNTKRFLFNNTHLAYLNILRVLPSANQLKLNLSYLNDYTIANTSNNTTYFLPTGNVSFTENINSSTNTNKIVGTINFTKNKSTTYLKNNTDFGLDIVSQNSTVQNNTLVNQNFANPFYSFKNELTFFKPIHKTIVGFNSKININKMPQQLDIVPGQFASIFNQALPYEKALQQASIINFNTDNNVSFSTKKRKALHQMKFGVAYANQNLTSETSKLYNQTFYNLNNSFKNNINWRQSKIYAENTISFAKRERTLDITLPLELNLIDANSKLNSAITKQHKFFFNPTIDFNLPLNSKFILGVVYNYQNNTGTIGQITNGFILKNYRTLSKNDNIIPLEHQQLFNLSLSYKNPLSAIFGNISVSFSQTNKNAIYSQEFVNYFVTSKFILLPNKQQSVLAVASLSKYILEQKLNLSLGFTINNITTDLLQQSKLLKSNSQLYNSSLKINYSKLNWLNIDALSRIGVYKNKINEISNTYNTNSNFYQNVKIYFVASSKINLNFSNELYSIKESNNKAQNYYFADLGVTKKTKIADLELVWFNITNNKTFNSITNNNNFRQVYQYKIRPTNVLFKVNFKF